MVDGLVFDTNFRLDTEINGRLQQLYAGSKNSAITAFIGKRTGWFADIKGMVQNYKMSSSSWFVGIGPDEPEVWSVATTNAEAVIIQETLDPDVFGEILATKVGPLCKVFPPPSPEQLTTTTPVPTTTEPATVEVTTESPPPTTTTELKTETIPTTIKTTTTRGTTRAGDTTTPTTPATTTIPLPQIAIVQANAVVEEDKCFKFGQFTCLDNTCLPSSKAEFKIVKIVENYFFFGFLFCQKRNFC